MDQKQIFDHYQSIYSSMEQIKDIALNELDSFMNKILIYGQQEQMLHKQIDQVNDDLNGKQQQFLKISDQVKCEYESFKQNIQQSKQDIYQIQTNVRTILKVDDFTQTLSLSDDEEKFEKINKEEIVNIGQQIQQINDYDIKSKEIKSVIEQLKQVISKKDETQLNNQIELNKMKLDDIKSQITNQDETMQQNLIKELSQLNDNIKVEKQKYRQHKKQQRYLQQQIGLKQCKLNELIQLQNYQQNILDQ